jgi:uncharacterized protein (TIGR03435 family)
MILLLLEIAVRATLIAGTVSLILLMMRVRQAALRHSVWTGVDLPAYALTLAKRDGKLGPSLRRSDADCSSDNGPKPAASPCGFRIGDGALLGRGATIEKLAAELILTGRLVVNRTGLSGVFDMDMKWTPDELGTNADLFTALQEQLGLKLEAIRAPVEVIVIDSASRPLEN